MRWDSLPVLAVLPLLPLGWWPAHVSALAMGQRLRSRRWKQPVVGVAVAGLYVLGHAVSTAAITAVWVLTLPIEDWLGVARDSDGVDQLGVALVVLGGSAVMLPAGLIATLGQESLQSRGPPPAVAAGRPLARQLARMLALIVLGTLAAQILYSVVGRGVAEAHDGA